MVRELAQQLRRQHGVQPEQSQPTHSTEKAQQHSRILREEELRQQHAQYSVAHHVSSSTIDLPAFKRSWANRDQHEQEPTHYEYEKQPPAYSPNVCLTEIIPIENQESSPNKKRQLPTATQSSQTNPWEMLRDHFIHLREQRLALEKTKKSDEN